MSRTGSQLQDLVQRIVGFGADATDDTLARNLLLRPAAKWVVHKASTDAAGTTAYRLVCDAGLDGQVMIDEVKVVDNTTQAADGSNYATLQLVSNDGAGGSDTVIGTIDTSATGFTAKVARSMTLTAANQVVAAGKQLEVVITKTGTGLALTAMSIIVKGHPV